MTRLLLLQAGAPVADTEEVGRQARSPWQRRLVLPSVLGRRMLILISVVQIVPVHEQG